MVIRVGEAKHVNEGMVIDLAKLQQERAVCQAT